MARGLTPKLLTDLCLIASLLCSFKTFMEADRHSSVHIHSPEGLSLSGFHESTRIVLWPRDCTEVWGLGREGHSAILTGYFNIYSCVQTTTEPLILLVYSYKADDRASQENKSCNPPETPFLLLCFFSRETQCCVCVYSTAFGKEPLVLQQGFIVKFR